MKVLTVLKTEIIFQSIKKWAMPHETGLNVSAKKCCHMPAHTVYTGRHGLNPFVIGQWPVC